MTKINIISETKDIDLSIVKSPSQTMTSRDIAELTGKQHKDVMRDIRKMFSELGERNFALSSYYSEQGKKIPMYELDKKHTLCLTSGYSAKLRMKIIDKIEELEEQPLRQLLNQLTLQGRIITNNGSQWGKSGVEQKKAKKVWQIHLDAVINEINQELDLFLTIK